MTATEGSGYKEGIRKPGDFNMRFGTNKFEQFMCAD
jgi:hypothetical protein